MIAIKKSRRGQLWYKEIKKILLSRNIILHGEVSLYIFKKINIIINIIFYTNLKRLCRVLFILSIIFLFFENHIYSIRKTIVWKELTYLNIYTYLKARVRFHEIIIN